jgi:hypothetical protein
MDPVKILLGIYIIQKELTGSSCCGGDQTSTLTSGAATSVVADVNVVFGFFSSSLDES